LRRVPQAIIPTMAVRIARIGGILAFAIFLTPVCAQERRYYGIAGGVDALYPSPGAIIFRWRGDEYTIALADLPTSKEICGDCESFKYTLGSALAMYEPTVTLYIVAAGDAWQNRQWHLFSYDLKTNRAHPIASVDGGTGGFSAAALSRSGQYIAFSSLIRAGYMGACSYDVILVVDVHRKRYAHVYKWGSLSAPGSFDGHGSITKIHWVDSNKLEFQADVYSQSACEGKEAPTHSVTETIDVTKLKFQ
jgi:hypothetical protein